MNMKQKKIKIEPRIKLNYNRYKVIVTKSATRASLVIGHIQRLFVE